jgi:hypothetical protein
MVLLSGTHRSISSTRGWGSGRLSANMAFTVGLEQLHQTRLWRDAHEVLAGPLPVVVSMIVGDDEDLDVQKLVPDTVAVSLTMDRR